MSVSLQKREVGDPSLPYAVTKFYYISDGRWYPGRGSSLLLHSRIASVSLPREGLVLGNGEAKGKRTLETLLMLPMKMFAFQVTFFCNALKFTCLVICSADG